MHLYLIRHGQSHVNLAEWTNGNLDVGLTDAGQRQARALAGWLPARLPAPDAVYCSTMRRARETVAPLAAAYDVDVTFDDRLREIGNNRHDHRPWPDDDLPKEFAEYWASDRPFASITPSLPGGESLMHFRARVGQFLDDMVHQYPAGTIVGICHGGVIGIVLDIIFNVGPWRRCEVWCDNTGITHVEHVVYPEKESWRLHAHSRVEHLTPELVT